MSKDFSVAATNDVIQKAKGALEEHGFKVEVVDDVNQAREKVLSLIPKQSEVFTATSETLKTAGLDEALNDSKNYRSVRAEFMPLASEPDKAIEMRRIGSAGEYAVGSVHALTEDGQAVIASASGSQLPNYVYGADHVIWVVGSQKIVANLDEAFDRIENYTYQLEDARLMKAHNMHSILAKLLVYRREPRQRVIIVIIKEAVGF